MSPEELNELLAKSRDQKFRKKTQAQLDGLINQTIASQSFWDSLSKKEKEQLIAETRDYDEWLIKNIEKNKDPKVRAKLSKSQTESWQDLEKALIRLIGQQAYWSNEENRKARQEFHKSKKFMDAIDKRSSDPSFGKKISLGKMKPIHVPWGEYPSKQDAEQGGRDQGIKNVERKILKGLKEDKENFYYK